MTATKLTAVEDRAASFEYGTMIGRAVTRLRIGEFESIAPGGCDETLCTSDAHGVACAVLAAAGVPGLLAERQKIRGLHTPAQATTTRYRTPYGWLATTPPDSKLRFAVTGQSEEGAAGRYGRSLARWEKALANVRAEYETAGVADPGEA